MISITYIHTHNTNDMYTTSTNSHDDIPSGRPFNAKWMAVRCSLPHAQCGALIGRGGEDINEAGRNHARFPMISHK